MAFFLSWNKKDGTPRLSFLLVIIAHSWHHFGLMSILLWQGTYFTERLWIKTSSNRQQLTFQPHLRYAETTLQRGYLLQRGSKWLFMVLKGITETARYEYYS